MQDDNLENMGKIIRVASDSYHPAYDEKAWNKMEALLGKRLPQKEKKKGRLFFILLLIGIGFVAFLIIMIRN